MVFRQFVLVLFTMCRSSLIISSRCNSPPLITTSLFACLGGVADSSTIMHGFRFRSASCAGSLYALCPSIRV